MSDRLAVYVFALIVICAEAAVIGETFFPAGGGSDLGGSDFDGLAAIVWALGALVVCLAGCVGYEIYVRYRARRSNVD